MTVSPVSGAAQDFRQVRTYTVTAQDQSSVSYQVTVTSEPNPAWTDTGRFVAMSRHYVLNSEGASVWPYAWSDDGGDTWTVKGLSTDGYNVPFTFWQNLAYGGGTFVVLSYYAKTGRNIALWSDDGGETWNSVTLPDIKAKADGNWQSLVYGEGKFIAIGGVVRPLYAGRNEVVGISSDGGKTWTTKPLPALETKTGTTSVISNDGTYYPYWARLVYNDNDEHFYALSNWGHIARSDDGQIWAMVLKPSSSDLQDAILGGPGFAPHNGDYWFSELTVLAYNDGVFLASTEFALGGKYAWSVDGTTWTKTSIPSSFNLQADSDQDHIGGPNGTFVVLSYGIGGGISFNYSAGSWTLTQFNEDETASECSSTERMSVTYGGGRFVSMNGDRPAYSENGTTWTYPDPKRLLTDLPVPSYGTTGEWTITYGDKGTRDW